MVSVIKLKKRLACSIQFKENIYLADYIEYPFVFGLVKPKIYLPSTLPESEFDYIILHEKYHMKRLDYLIKGFAFAVLCIHWFNPFVWMAFVLASTDMEMSCDEAVLKELGENAKADYSYSLLRFAAGKKHIPATFLAFGEVSPKSRIRNVLNWKKPITSVTICGAVLVGILGILCLTNPPNRIALNLKYDLTVETEAYEAFEEEYGFSPVRFGTLPEDMVFEKIVMEDPKVRFLYKGVDDRYFELLIIVPNHTWEDEVIRIDGELKAAYEMQAKNFSVNVQQYEEFQSKKTIMSTYFLGEERTFYHITGYHVKPIEFDEVVRNLMLD
jgi:hypothetical protein